MKKYWLWALMILLLLASLPGLGNRWSVEKQNNTYEFVVPYEEVIGLLEEAPPEPVLQRLHHAGVNTISFQPVSLADLVERQRIAVYTRQQLMEKLRFSNAKTDFDKLGNGYYVPIPDNRDDAKWIQKQLHPNTVHIAGNTFLHIKMQLGLTKSTELGYDETAVKAVQNEGMQPIFRMKNAASKRWRQQMSDQLVQMKINLHTRILFSGEEVLGYPRLETIKSYTQKLSDAGFDFYSIEFAGQKGMQTVAKSTDYDVIRQHSIDLHNDTPENNADRAVRAIKERNIRSIFVHIPDENNSLSEALDKTINFVETVRQDVPEKYVLEQPAPFASIQVSLWNKAAALVAGILFTFLISRHVFGKKIRISMTALLCLLAIGYFLTQQLALLKIFALVIAIAAPIAATLSAWDGAPSMTAISLRYLKAVVINLIGIIIVAGLLNGNGFITGFELFRGVKLVYIVPIVVVAFVVFRSLLQARFGGNDLIRFLHSPVTFWHVIVIFFVAAIGLYYISRTGNGGSVSGMELYVRQALEEMLYVRPRTKEILIGFPAFVTAMYAAGVGKKWGHLLLIPASIGFLSMINTFTHFHIPLYVSVLRMFYGIVFGFIVGVIIIFLWKWIGIYWRKFQPIKR